MKTGARGQRASVFPGIVSGHDLIGFKNSPWFSLCSAFFFHCRLFFVIRLQVLLDSIFESLIDNLTKRILLYIQLEIIQSVRESEQRTVNCIAQSHLNVNVHFN